MSETSPPEGDLRPAIRAEIDRVCPEMRTGLAMDVPMPPLTQAQLLAALRALPEGAGAQAAVVAFYREAGLPIPRPGERPAWLEAAARARRRPDPTPDRQRSDQELERAIFAEFARIGLRLEEMPGVGVESEPLADLLDRLRRVPAGASWAEVFPNARRRTPDQADDAQRRDSPDPIAPFDDLAPEGCAIVAFFDPGVGDDAWDVAVAALRARGVPVHSAGVIWRRPDFLKAGVVLRVGASHDAALGAFDLAVDTLHAQPGIWNLRIARYGFDYHGYAGG